MSDASARAKVIPLPVAGQCGRCAYWSAEPDGSVFAAGPARGRAGAVGVCLNGDVRQPEPFPYVRAGHVCGAFEAAGAT